MVDGVSGILLQSRWRADAWLVFVICTRFLLLMPNQLQYSKPTFSFYTKHLIEMGHNFNLAHSGGLDGKTYTDHTCLMGNPLYDDDIGAMCFNS